MSYYRDDWDQLLAEHGPEFWRCGVPYDIYHNKAVFLTFLRDGYYVWGSSRYSRFDGRTLSEEELARLADLAARYVDPAFREPILSRWRMARLRPLLESTGMVRYSKAWREFLPTLKGCGIDVEKYVIFYCGPGGTIATLGLVGEDTMAIGIDLDRDPSDGSIRVSDRMCWDNADDREQREAKGIWETGQIEWFNTLVRQYWQDHGSDFAE